MRTAWAFAVALFVSATLLFTCQPMVARMIMPILGGAPAVWIVCSLCSQALLLAGYGYAHLLGTRLSIRAQVIVQLVLVAVVFVALPISVDPVVAERLTAEHPTFGVVALFLRTTGPVFFVLSSTSPLLQRWIVELGEDDPYYLYIASNAGSMLSLLGYPVIVEPMLTLGGQSRALTAGYVLYAVLIATCAFYTVRAAKVRAPRKMEAAPPSLVPAIANVWVERLVWLGLAFAPSSLLLSATQYVTTDIASVPFLWVAPLALYLGSFMIAFAKKPLVKPAVLSRVLALLTVLIVLTQAAGNAQAPWLLVGPHFLLVLVGSTVCHYGLAIRRPKASRLTEFYFVLSLGGVMGGIFNGLLAPAIFTDLYEYPIAVGLVAVGRLALEPAEATDGMTRRDVLRDIGLGLALTALTYALVRVGTHFRIEPRKSFLWMFGVPLFVVYVWKARPIRFGVALAGIFVATMLFGDRATANLLHRERSFFGVLGVMQDPEGRFRILVHGRINHGREVLDPALKDRPSSYYTLEGPVGDILGPAGGSTPRSIGVLGLGIGGLARYARAGDTWTFFELDPAVVDIARTRFGVLADADKVTKVEVEVGDGRLRLQHGPAARFDILILDAFTSDGVPVHLLTREALVIYKRVLKPGGLLLANSSNSHLNLRPVFGALAKDGGMSAITRFDPADDERIRNGAESSIWVLFSELPEKTAAIQTRTNGSWKPIDVPAKQVVWTDDYSNVLGALK